MPDQQTAEAVRQAWGQALKDERKRRRLWQSEIAEQSGVSQGTVSEVENGQGSLDSFLAIARTLGIDLFGSL